MDMGRGLNYTITQKQPSQDIIAGRQQCLPLRHHLEKNIIDTHMLVFFL